MGRGLGIFIFIVGLAIAGYSVFGAPTSGMIIGDSTYLILGIVVACVGLFIAAITGPPRYR